ncbi:MAG: transporter [Deltaproteobacteria bacterium]|nr:transporter [Deltaproteobacteria bacterium]
MHLELKGIRKSYGGKTAVDGVDLDIGVGDFVCILGPSGCGKTTLLRILAGLIEPDSGEIRLDGRDLTKVPARHRGFGIVFQSYSLFPNMTASENIAYGLKVRRQPVAAIRSRVAELLEMIGLSGSGAKLPDQLSGGEQQRIALARAIAVEPALLLLDEPLSALDVQVRVSLRRQIRALQKRLRIPTLMVTHDQEEAMEMADRIVCMNEGRIEQIGTPRELYQSPSSPFVAGFIGAINFLPGPIAARLLPEHATAPALPIGIRPESLRLAVPSGAAGELLGSVAAMSFLGGTLRVLIDVEGHDVVVVVSPEAPWRVGMVVSLSAASGAALMFSR